MKWLLSKLDFVADTAFGSAGSVVGAAIGVCAVLAVFWILRFDLSWITENNNVGASFVAAFIGALLGSNRT